MMWFAEGVRTGLTQVAMSVEWIIRGLIQEDAAPGASTKERACLHDHVIGLQPTPLLIIEFAEGEVGLNRMVGVPSRSQAILAVEATINGYGSLTCPEILSKACESTGSGIGTESAGGCEATPGLI